MSEPDFDRVAPLYRWAEYAVFQRSLERTRLDLLEEVLAHNPRRALVLGDGDGRFLARLLSRVPALTTLAVDTSGAMLRLLTQRCRHAAPLATPPATLRASALSLTGLPPGTDLIVSHFFLDCFHQAQLEILIGTLSAAAAPGSLWLLSDFAIMPQPWLRSASALLIRALYAAFQATTGLRVTRLPAIAPTMLSNNWLPIARKQRLGGLLYTELWQHQ